MVSPVRKGKGPALLLILHHSGLTGYLKTEAYKFAKLGYTTEFPRKRSAVGVAFFPYGNHGFASTESDGYQPELAELVWPLVVKFSGRELGPPAP